MNKRIASSIAMVIGTMIWGAAFVFQSKAMEHIGPFTLGSLRFALGTLVILPLLFFKKTRPDPATDAPLQEYIKAGVLCGAMLFLGVTFQQIGIMYTTAGKAGFVTALYMVLVPIFASILFRRKIRGYMWLLVLLAFFGVFLLCVVEEWTISKGDILVFIGSIFWAAQILCLEKFAPNLDSVKLSVVQFLVCSLFSAVPMFAMEHPTLPALSAALIPILYCGILSVGVAFTAQVICLKHADAIVAALIMSLESVFAVLFGFLLLRETLSAKQLLGCALVLAAVILSELLPRLRKPGEKIDASADAQYNEVEADVDS